MGDRLGTPDAVGILFSPSPPQLPIALSFIRFPSPLNALMSTLAEKGHTKHLRVKKHCRRMCTRVCLVCREMGLAAILQLPTAFCLPNQRVAVHTCIFLLLLYNS